MDRLFDTSLLIRHLRGDTRAAALLGASLRPRRALLSPITVTEILVGCLHEQHTRTARALLRRFRTVPITSSVAEKAAHLIRTYPQFFGRGVERGVADAFILACAWERQAQLYTLNTRHFVSGQITEVEIRALDPNASGWQ
jgi:predicted nucleic acid-binding protein